MPGAVGGQEGLAEKLDQELDEHLEAILERNKNYRYKDGLSEENWEEEIKKIPLFAKDITQEDIDNSPELQAMQALKYECDSPVESALALKDDGNYNFQKKKYKEAIVVYGEAIKEKHTDMQLYATLYTNRAAANFHLGNNRTALNDAMRALHYAPTHMKALSRCAVCCYDLERYDDCISWCQRGLEVDAKDLKLEELIRKSKHQKKQKERDERKAETRKMRDLTKRKLLICAFEERKIDIESKKTVFETLTTENGIAPHSGKLYLDGEGALHWPLYLLYPESNHSDFIEDFNENHQFYDHLRIVFECPPDWDEKGHYTFDNIEMFVEDRTQKKMIRVGKEKTLREVLSDERYLMRGGCPGFMILSKTTEFYKKHPAIGVAEEF